jgi:hypothetical protein
LVHSVGLILWSSQFQRVFLTYFSTPKKLVRATSPAVVLPFCPAEPRDGPSHMPTGGPYTPSLLVGLPLLRNSTHPISKVGYRRAEEVEPTPSTEAEASSSTVPAVARTSQPPPRCGGWASSPLRDSGPAAAQLRAWPTQAPLRLGPVTSLWIHPASWVRAWPVGFGDGGRESCKILQRGGWRRDC